MAFLEKLKCFVFLVSIVPSKVPNSMRVSKMEGKVLSGVFILDLLLLVAVLALDES